MTDTWPAWPVALGTFPMYRGDASGRNKVVATLTDQNDAPVDLTPLGTTWRAAARDPDGLVITLTVDATNKATGVLVIAVPDGASAGLADRLDFDVQVSGGPINPLTTYTGSFTAAGQVTV